MKQFMDIDVLVGPTNLSQGSPRCLMVYCVKGLSQIYKGHLCLLDYVESKALKIIGIVHDEAKAQVLLPSYHSQVGGLCFLLPLLFHCSLCTLSSNPPKQFQDARALKVTPSWLNFQNSRWLHTFLKGCPYLILPSGVQASSAPPSCHPQF